MAGGGPKISDMEIHYMAVLQGTIQLCRSNWGLGILLRDTSTHPGQPSDCLTTALAACTISHVYMEPFIPYYYIGLFH